MKKTLSIILGLLVLVPGLAIAASTNGQGAVNSNSSSSNAVSNNNITSTGQDNSTTANQAQTQTQTNNPGTGTMAQVQTQDQERIQQEIANSQPQYSPKNSKGIERRSIVANAVQSMLQIANKTENQGIGQQIKLIAQTQSQNQDKIGQSIDKAEARSAFAKFFIGANYSELKSAQDAMIANQNQIKELEQLMTQLSSDADKIAMANEIIALQQTQLELRDQITNVANGFSLFGWISRWKNNF